MYQIVIIGAGPAGLSMGVEARSFGVREDHILILEKAHEHSFTIKKYYAENKIVTANYKGFTPTCTGVMCLSDSTKQETISYMDKAIEDYKLNTHYNETVHKIERDNKRQKFKLYTDKDVYESTVVAIAVGILGKPNKPNYKLPSSLRKKILFDITSFEIKNSKVLVVGGGDSASEYCQFLVEENDDVFLSYRKENFSRMNDINQQSITTLSERGKVKLLLNSNISEIVDDNGKPEVIFTEPEIEPIVFDYVIYALGGTTPHNFLKMIGIEFNGPEPFLKEGYETNIPGLFLIGDLSAGKKGGSIVWAFNSANTAMKKICTNYLLCERE